VAPPSDEDFRAVDRMLDELMVKHFEMAHLLGEYRDLLADLEERPWDKEKSRLARALPGAKYHVTYTYSANLALGISAELKRMFPPEED
jgi:hypothetical protein